MKFANELHYIPLFTYLSPFSFKKICVFMCLFLRNTHKILTNYYMLHNETGLSLQRSRVLQENPKNRLTIRETTLLYFPLFTSNQLVPQVPLLEK